MDMRVSNQWVYAVYDALTSLKTWVHRIEMHKKGIDE